jgi:hypothetical protein
MLISNEDTVVQTFQEESVRIMKSSALEIGFPS